MDPTNKGFSMLGPGSDDVKEESGYKIVGPLTHTYIIYIYIYSI